MKTYTPDELKTVLAEHAKWVLDAQTGARAYLEDANLEGANLEDAYLTGAYLEDAYLEDAYLTGANLTGANLEGANLEGAYLTGAYLTGANLTGANLTGANLTGANLTGANLTGANLTGANLTGALGLTGRSVCPPVGAFTAYKQTREGVVLELLVPPDAERVSSHIGRKCRASKVWVVRALGSEVTTFTSTHDSSFKYQVGHEIRPSTFSNDRRIECAPGIHFFMEKEEAEAYGK